MGGMGHICMKNRFVQLCAEKWSVENCLVCWLPDSLSDQHQLPLHNNKRSNAFMPSSSLSFPSSNAKMPNGTAVEKL